MTLETLAWWSVGILGAGITGAALRVTYDVWRENREAAAEAVRCEEERIREMKARWSGMRQLAAAPRHASVETAMDPEPTVDVDSLVRVAAHARLEDIPDLDTRALVARYRLDGPLGSLGTLDGRPAWAQGDETPAG